MLVVVAEAVLRVRLPASEPATAPAVYVRAMTQVAFAASAYGAGPQNG
jgi:hypothetical protein